MSFPAYVHGMLKMEAFAGALRPDEAEGKVVVRVPEDRRPEQTKLEVRYSPTLAGALVEALPYLADYPYGCTEQTLNRFVPGVITRRTLLEMGLNLKDIAAKRSNLNPQEIGDDPKRAEDWKRAQRKDYNPVFDEPTLDAMVSDGVNKLANQQIADGGWGWFSGFGERSWPHTTRSVTSPSARETMPVRTWVTLTHVPLASLKSSDTRPSKTSPLSGRSGSTSRTASPIR